MKKQHVGVVKLFYRVVNKVTSYKTQQNYISAVANALNLGYRLIDYSSAYGDGVLLQKAIEKSGIARTQLFITTRVSNRAQREDKVREEFMFFLHNMNLEYVDLLQFHWPVTGLYLDTWREMEKLKDEGLVKHLGVANCHQHHLEEIFKICKHRPEVGQFEIHPLFTQKPLIQYYKDNGIVVEAYTPIARYDDRLVRLPLLKRLEKKYNKTFVQIILRWHVQNGVIPLVRSLSYKHQQENFDIFDFILDEEDMKTIDSININSRLRYDPDNCDFSIL
ncbi:MAG: aldo/keto reductase [Bacteroidales bacterium]|nr:aldo/keto reductase [Bacteroidales bacterium]